MLLVIFAQRTNAVITEEFVRVEHTPKQRFHSVPAGKRDEATLANAQFLPARDQTAEIRAVREIPFETRFESGERVDQLRLNCLHREQWHQTDERSDFERQKASARRV